ncbi:MAG: hypothetical protein ACO3NZ_11285, partial [Pirellulales bacterium]
GQFGQRAGSRRLLPGPLGLAATPVLAIFAGGMVGMTLGGTAGVGTGVVALILLGGLRAWESRSASAG